MGFCASGGSYTGSRRRSASASYPLQPPFRGVCKGKRHQHAEFRQQHRHANFAEHPPWGRVQPFPWVQHEELIEVPLIQDYEQIEQHEGRSVGHIFAVGKRGEGHARQRPEGPRCEEHQGGLQQVAKVIRHGFSGLRVGFHGQEHERGKAVGYEYAKGERQPAGNGAAHGLPRDIPRHGGAGQVLLYEAALHVVNEGRGIGQRGEYGQGQCHGLGRQRAHDKVAVVAGGKQLRRTEPRQYPLNRGKERNERRAREGDQKAPRAHRLPEI